MEKYKNIPDMDKVRLLYQKQEERFGQSKFTMNQYETAKALKEFYKRYDSTEEAGEAIKSSPLYTAMAQALVLDELAAEEKAALARGMEDLASVYRKQFDRVKEDYSAAFDVSYVEEVKKKSARWSKLLSAFNDGLRAYYLVKAEPQFEGMGDPQPLADLAEQLKLIESEGYSLEDLAQQAYIKKQTGLPDEIVREYIVNAQALVSGRLSFDENVDFKAEVDQAVGQVLASSDEIDRLANSEDEYFPGGYCILVGPDTSGGRHEFILDRKEDKGWRLK